MNLPGNNTITLCGKALCEIVEKHFADSYYSREKPVHVTGVQLSNDQFAPKAIFTVTTDGDKTQQPA